MAGCLPLSVGIKQRSPIWLSTMRTLWWQLAVATRSVGFRQLKIIMGELPVRSWGEGEEGRRGEEGGKEGGEEKGEGKGGGGEEDGKPFLFGVWFAIGCLWALSNY